MRRYGTQVNAEFVHRYLKFANGLRGITEEERAAFVGKFRQFPNRLEDAGLVVRQHDRDQDRIVAQCGTEQFRIQSSVRLDRQTGDLGSIPLEMFEDVEYRPVLGGTGDEVPTFGLISRCCPLCRG